VAIKCPINLYLYQLIFNQYWQSPEPVDSVIGDFLFQQRLSVGLRFLVVRPNCPLETYAFQVSNALRRQMTWFPPFEKLVLSSLALHPNSQWCVFTIAARDTTMPMDAFEFHKLLKSVPPSDALCVPNKTDVFQSLDAVSSHRRRLAFHHELVLVTLSFDPSSQCCVWAVREWHKAVSVSLSIIDKVLETPVPHI